MFPFLVISKALEKYINEIRSKGLRLGGSRLNVRKFPAQNFDVGIYLQGADTVYMP